MRSHRIARLTAVPLAAALLAVGIPAAGPATAATSTRPAVAPGPAGIEHLDRQTPAWGSCGVPVPELQCATVVVPLDYRQPAGATLAVAVSRVRATRPDLRRGILLMNPGGPGNSGLLLPATVGRVLPAGVRDGYDLVGFDPRGVGRSAPVSCGLTPEQANYLLLPPESFAVDVRRQAGVAAACVRAAGAVLPFLTTRNTARDMDVIREVLGEPKLSYLGYSYGTYLGAVYTQMFGEHADRIVLDSAVDPANVWRGLARAVAPALERGLDRWAAWTATQDGRYGLGTSGPVLRARFDRLLGTADRHPVGVDDWTLSGQDLRTITFGIMYDDRLFPVLADLVRVALVGGRLQPAVHEFVANALTPPAGDNDVAAQLAVLCDDAAWPHRLGVYAADKARDAARYPFYGASASTVKPCTFWPYRPLEPVTPIGPGNRAPGILIVQSEFDVATPASGAAHLHLRLTNSRLLMLRGAQKHIVFAVYGDACVDAAVADYLVGGALPPEDLTCATPPAGAAVAAPRVQAAGDSNSGGWAGR
jgi:pimeloyl-ACP methyl ester carboxylesterase